MPTPEDICKQILDLDKSIRLAAIANQMGSPVATAYRSGLEAIFSKEEIDSYMIKSVLQMKSAEDFESKLGNVIYTLILYSKLKRVVVPLEHPDFSVLLVSFDNSANHDDITVNKIFPLLRKWLGNIVSQA